jgi:hypothetical protein
VADIFRHRGPAWRASHAGHVSLGQLKVMSAIERCRTAALGGHIERCEDGAHLRISDNSCLMGKFGNGELAGGRVADPAGTSNDCGRLFSRFAPHNVAVPEIDVSADDCDPAARGR